MQTTNHALDLLQCILGHVEPHAERVKQFGPELFTRQLLQVRIRFKHMLFII